MAGTGKTSGHPFQPQKNIQSQGHSCAKDFAGPTPLSHTSRTVNGIIPLLPRDRFQQRVPWQLLLRRAVRASALGSCANLGYRMEAFRGAQTHPYKSSKFRPTCWVSSLSKSEVESSWVIGTVIMELIILQSFATNFRYCILCPGSIKHGP